MTNRTVDEGRSCRGADVRPADEWLPGAAGLVSSARHLLLMVTPARERFAVGAPTGCCSSRCYIRHAYIDNWRFSMKERRTSARSWRTTPRFEVLLMGRLTQFDLPF